MTTLVYSLLTWIRDNKDTLPAFGVAFADLSEDVEQILHIQQSCWADIERLRRPELGVNAAFLDRLRSSISGFLQKVYSKRAQIAEVDNGALLDISGLGLEALMILRHDILSHCADTIGTCNVTKHFDRYSMQWKMQLEVGAATRVFRVPSMPLPKTLDGASLREQLYWIQEDHDSSLEKLDAIAKDPNNWPTPEQGQHIEQERLKDLARMFGESLSPQDRELVCRNGSVFLKELARRLDLAWPEH